MTLIVERARRQQCVSQCVRFSHSRPNMNFSHEVCDSLSTKHTYTPVDTAVIINIA